ncbi:MAG: transporter [Gammaproteobacteria bacterium]|nr:transporter [Gammaproteobacteria bacterium]
MRTTLLVLFLSAFPIVASAEGSEHSEKQPTDFSDLTLEELLEVDVISINVLGTHTHLEGDWMLGYQFMFMSMDGNRDGTKQLSDSDVLADFPVTPTDMTMKMHMPMLMYAPSDDLTIMAMLPYIQLEMDHVTRTGVRFTTRSEGIGDLNVGALYTFYRRNFDEHRLIFNGAVSFPTGSINKKDFLANPAQGKKRLPYPMQLGSGTFDLHPRITYLGEKENWAWGGEVDATIRLGENSNDYTLGNRYSISAWGSWKWTDWLAPFVRIDGEVWENIDGADPDLNPTVVPTADPDRRGGERVDLLFGISTYMPKGTLKGHRLAIQAGLPIYQSLDGPQLETDWQITVGWQWVF